MDGVTTKFGGGTLSRPNSAVKQAIYKALKGDIPPVAWTFAGNTRILIIVVGFGDMHGISTGAGFGKADFPKG